MSTDHELLERYGQSRDQAAFEELVRRHGPLVLGVCRRVIGHHHDAEEAFQATFLVLAQKADAGPAPAALPNWLYGVAYRTALKRRSAIARRRAKEVQVTMFPEPAAKATDRWIDIAPLLDDELNRLPDKYQAAIVCCDLKGLSREVAARQLGWPEGTLKVRLMRGRAILAKRLARKGVVLTAGALAVAIAQNAASAAVPPALVASTVHAAGALAVTQAASTGIVGTKAVTVAKTSAKALVKPSLFGKVTVATSVGGVALAAVTATAALFVSAEPKAAAPQTHEIKLPAEIEQALRDNGRQLSPITIATKTRMESKLPQDEAIKRLGMAEAPNPQLLFAERGCRTILQDHKLYVGNTQTGATVDKKPMETLSECVFDGRFSILANRTNLPKSPPVLMKEPASKMLSRMPEAFFAISPYFQFTASYALSVEAQVVTAGELKVDYRLDPESALLVNLHKGGKLVSVEQVTLDGRPAVRVELEVQNPIRKGADLIDINQVREGQKHSRGSPQWKEQVLQGILSQRKLPATCLYAYYLDPALHYAVRRFDRSYAPNTLLSRTISSGFEKVPGRPVWLPRRIETEMHENNNFPGTVLPDSILTEVVEVTSYDFARVPDDTFVLNYTKPGTFIVDYTDATAKTKDGSVRYQIPEHPQELNAVIEKARNAPSPALLASRPLSPMEAPLQPAYRGKALIVIVLANVAAVVCGAAFYFWRRKKELE